MADGEPDPENAQQVEMAFRRLRQQQQQVHAKISELEQELAEHSLVQKTLSEIEGERRCWRLISGVLVERNVAEVLPAVTENRDGIQGIVDELKDKQKELAEEVRTFRAKYQIQERPSAGGSGAARSIGGAEHGATSGGEGVLV